MGEIARIASLAWIRQLLLFVQLGIGFYVPRRDRAPSGRPVPVLLRRRAALPCLLGWRRPVHNGSVFLTVVDDTEVVPPVRFGSENRREHERSEESVEHLL